MDVESGIVFHIIHGSFVDGFGVRTTVFLKGCPLRCHWCCNPEGQRRHPEIKFTISDCNGCGLCIPACPFGAIQFDPESDNSKVIIDREKCVKCENFGDCIEVCYTGALDRFGKGMTVNELFNIVKKDQQYYRASGGGVTIGGGEPTMQPEFTLALIRKCRENYIHTAVDTCGYTLTEEGFKVLEEADLLLYDMKGLDPDQHIRNTGVPNDPILKNLERLGAMGKPIIVRVPIVSGITDSGYNMEEIAEFLSRIKSVVRVDLIAYHQYGKIKYEQLDKEYKLNVDSPPPERLEEIMNIFRRSGLKVQLGG